MSAIALHSLSFSYPGASPVLSAISLTIEQGETWAIIGKNGSGKSTLLKCIGGILKTPGSSILVDGNGISYYKSIDFAKRIAYVPQAGNRMLPPYSAVDFVMLGRFPYQGFFALPSKEDRSIVRDALELTDTGYLAARPMNTLSGGEAQRVFLAAAVAQKTDILLLDEPMSFLDPQHQDMISRSLERIHTEFNTTIVAVTHDVNHAINRFSHICALVDGKAYFCGSSRQFSDDAPHKLCEVYSVTFFEIGCYEEDKRYFVPDGLIR